MGIATRKQKETEALRKRVLDTAEDIFVREGINQVTMRRIAASVDYAPTVLYRLFANKADLMDHLIARGYTGVRDQYEDVRQQKNLGPKAMLEGILATYADYALNHPDTTVLLETKGVYFGTIVCDDAGVCDTSDLQGVDEDLVVRPFGRKGEFIYASVRQGGSAVP